VTAWRNGGGRTRELFARPPAAGLDDFAWRVSVATIARSGPFSSYPGVVRIAVLVEGAGVVLAAADVRIELTQPLAQARFPGAPEWQCDLVEGPVELFNVMVRGAAAAPVRVIAGAPVALDTAAACVAYAVRGASELRAGARVARLAEGDACEITRPQGLQAIPADGACMLMASFAALQA
jgi:environmental stress-induced protein Ves